MKKTNNFENRIFLFLPVAPAIFMGIFADRFIFRWEEYYCTAILATVTLYVIPAVAWIRDLIHEWKFRVAIKKALDNAFEIVPVGKGLAKRMVVVTKQM